MAAKKQTKSKTRTSTKKQGFKFRWRMAAALVVVVALVGILVLRYSKASGYQSYAATTTANYGAIQLKKVGNGEILYVGQIYYGRYQKYTGNPLQPTLTCLRPLGSYKNSGPPELVGATNNFQEEPCV